MLESAPVNDVINEEEAAAVAVAAATASAAADGFDGYEEGAVGEEGS
jgi:hypothetical protein